MCPALGRTDAAGAQFCLKSAGACGTIVSSGAKVAEMADALDLGSSPLRRIGGSTPPLRTKTPFRRIGAGVAQRKSTTLPW